MKRWMGAAVAACVMALASGAEAQLALVCLGSSTSTTVQPEAAGANCPAGGLRYNVPACLVPLQSATTYYVCNGEGGSAGPQGPAGATGPAGPGLHYVDDNGFTIPDLYVYDSPAAPGMSHYWTGDAFWPIYEPWGMSILDTSPYMGQLLHYSSSSCTTPLVSRLWHPNNVFSGETQEGATGVPMRASTQVSVTGSCWKKNSSGTCVSLACPPGPWAEAVSAGSEPDLSAYATPFHLVAD